MKKRIILIISIIVIFVAGAGVLIWMMIRSDQSSKNSKESTSQQDNEKAVDAKQDPPEPQKVPNLSPELLGKKACEVFTQDLADKYVGNGAIKEEQIATASKGASISGCKYKKDSKVVLFKIYRFFNEDLAKNAPQDILKDTPKTSQVKNFVIGVDFKVNNNVSEDDANKLIAELKTKL